MTAEQYKILNQKLNELRALCVQTQIANVVTAQRVVDAGRAIARLKVGSR